MMNKREAFKNAREMYKGLKPSRVSGFTLTSDGKGVVVAGFEEPVMMVLHHETDIYRLMSMCQLALKRITDAKQAKKKADNGALGSQPG
jgi:hypothetical protein